MKTTQERLSWACMTALLIALAGCGGGGGGGSDPASTPVTAPASAPSPGPTASEPTAPNQPTTATEPEWRIKLSLNTGQSVQKMQFLDDLTGVAVGTTSGNTTTPFGVYTDDGGTTWRDITFPSGTNTPKDIAFTDKQVGWLIVSGQFVTAINNGFSLSLNDKLLKTSDGGLSWTDVTPNVALDNFPSSLYRVYFQSALQGWLSSNSGLFKTSDGGSTWTKVGNSYPASQLKFTSAVQGWGLSTTNGVMTTSDGGSTWVTHKVGGTAMVASDTVDVVESTRAAYFLDDQHAWVAAQPRWTTGSTITLYRTVDSGATWQALTTPTAFYGGLHFVSALQGWGLGSGGELYETQDGGSTWVKVAKVATSTRGSGSLIMTSPTKAWSIGLVDGSNPFSPDQQLRSVELP